ncbi:hydroxymethylbilane synthase [Peptoclostridium sp. AF21-18]|uniref:hydroxymethylbilane synthase n=1 Tax=Peptoclostridium sp. AF21-18 TaxID=2292243 RepID=UPI000E50A92A|nr:hydroxymethylbilane synthase [Peptoclostridium sp. AF21-18]RHQ98892.1 hydroxymethylbilane synthase [Peptoclostridium sp. AF21-18]
MKIRVGTRGSNLALIQTNWAIDRLKEKFPEVEFEVKIIKTKGDKILHLSLDKIGDKGLFVKEIESQLLEGEIDLAVHSMKDMPAEVVEGLKFAAVPKREDPRDVIILREGLNSFDELPIGATIGTGSKRRKYQLLRKRPDLNIVPIRGNIETRISKIESENLDGIVLAASGVIRADLEEKITEFLPVDLMIPAPAQGALALEIRENDEELEKMIDAIKDEISQIQIDAERSYLAGIDGSCHIPMGAYCEVDGEKLTLTGIFGDEDGEKITVASLEGEKDNPKELGSKLAKLVLEKHREE